MNWMYKLAAWSLILALIGGLWMAIRRPASRDDADAGARRPRTGDTLADWPPEPTRVLSFTERRAYTLLREVCPPDYMIFAHVPVSRFVRVAMQNTYAEWMRRVGNSCVDLLVCDGGARVIAAIEVRRPETAPVNDRIQRRRERVARVLYAAGISVQVWREGDFPSPDTVRQSLVEEDDPGMETQPAALFAADTPPTSWGQKPSHAGDDSGTATPPHAKPPPLPPSGTEPKDPPPSTWFDDIPTDLPFDLSSDRSATDAKPPGSVNSTTPGRTPSR